MSAEDTQQLLKEMREVSPDAADDYLEHVIVVRRSTVSISLRLDCDFRL